MAKSSPLAEAPATSGSIAARSQTIERATLILACFSASEPYLKLADLAAKLGLNTSTVYRYVATLESAGLLERDERRGGYRLGLRVIELAGIALNQLEVRKHAVDDMDRLCHDLGLLVNLGVLLEGDVLHVAHAAPPDVLRLFTSLGRRAVAHCTALGKVMLADKPFAEVRQLIEQYGWRPYTPESIQAFEPLEQELEAIRTRGYAVDHEERRRGIACLAAPIRDYSGRVVAALSISSTTDQMTEEYQRQIRPRVLQVTELVSLRLGYHGDAS